MSGCARVGKRLICGFTLVELLTVLAVIAVIVSLLLPALSRAREQAKALHCISNMRQIGGAMMVFASNNDGRLPGGGQGASSLSWQNVLNAEVFKGKAYIPRTYGKSPVKNALACPTAVENQIVISSGSGNTGRMYGINRRACGDNETSTIGVELYIKPPSQRQSFYPGSTLVEYWLGLKLSAVQNPSTKYLITESENREVIGGSNSIALNWAKRPWAAGADGDYSFRHPNLTMNVVFMDGHVEAVPFTTTAMHTKYFSEKY